MSRGIQWTGFIESLRGLCRSRRALIPAGQEAQARSQFITLQEKLMGETPSISFATQMAVYLADPMARSAVDFLAEQVAGPGFYTTAEDEEAKNVVDDFNAYVNMDNMLLTTAREIVGFGNCFWERNDDSVKILPILGMEKIVRSPQGFVQGYKQISMYGGQTLKPDSIIHFQWNSVNCEAFGSGLLRTICEELRISDSEMRLSFAEMKARMQHAMIDQFEKFSAPNELWIFRNLSADELHAYASQLRKIPRKGARFAYNDEADIKQATQQLGRGWEAYAENIINDFLLGIQTPIPRLFTTPGFTEASARAALEVAERKVMSLQRFLKRIIEIEVFNPLLRKAGYNPTEARVRLNWGQPEIPQLEVKDMILAYEKGAIRLPELRNMLVKAGWELSLNIDDKSNPNIR